MKIQIKITGNGTREEVYESLRSIADEIAEKPSGELMLVQWEDATLFTEISEYEEEDEE